jgi:hypothetical protein
MYMSLLRGAAANFGRKMLPCSKNAARHHVCFSLAFVRVSC